jgi:hypothetical protein
VEHEEDNQTSDGVNYIQPGRLVYWLQSSCSN